LDLDWSAEEVQWLIEEAEASTYCLGDAGGVVWCLEQYDP